MEVPNCRRCGRPPTFFVPSGGGNGVRCDTCGASYHHQTFTKEQMARIWAYRQAAKGEDIGC